MRTFNVSTTIRGAHQFSNRAKILTISFRSGRIDFSDRSLARSLERAHETTTTSESGENVFDRGFEHLKIRRGRECSEPSKRLARKRFDDRTNDFFTFSHARSDEIVFSSTFSRRRKATDSSVRSQRDKETTTRRERSSLAESASRGRENLRIKMLHTACVVRDSISASRRA